MNHPPLKTSALAIKKNKKKSQTTHSDQLQVDMFKNSLADGCVQPD